MSPLKARVVGYVFLIIAIVLFLLRLSVQKYIQVCSWIGMAVFFTAMVILFIFGAARVVENFYLYKGR